MVTTLPVTTVLSSLGFSTIIGGAGGGAVRVELISAINALLQAMAFDVKIAVDDIVSPPFRFVSVQFTEFPGENGKVYGATLVLETIGVELVTSPLAVPATTINLLCVI